MWSYSSLLDLNDGLPEFECKRLAGDRGGQASRRWLTLSSITGTYVENGGICWGEYPPLNGGGRIASFISPAVGLPLPRKGPDEVIKGAELAAACPPVRQAVGC